MMKPATAKAKGRETENALVEYLRSVDIPAERRRLTGAHDQGDIAGWPGVCIEVKSGAKVAIAQWLKELRAERINAGARTGAVAVRPKGKPDPGDWYVVMPLPQWLDLMGDAGYIPSDPLPEQESTQ